MSDELEKEASVGEEGLPKLKKRVRGPDKRTRKPTPYQKEGVKAARRALAQRREDISAFIRHLAEGCKVCKHPQRDEIEIAYTTGASPRSLAQEFGVTQRTLKAHADAFEWETARLRNTDAIMARLYGAVLESLDVTKLSPRDKIEFLTRMAREQNRIQGRIINKVDVNANKSVTFIAVPLPGGAPPILPESKKQLVKGEVVEAQFLQPGDPDESGETVEAARSLPPGTGEGSGEGGGPGSGGNQKF